MQFFYWDYATMCQDHRNSWADSATGDIPERKRPHNDNAWEIWDYDTVSADFPVEITLSHQLPGRPEEQLLREKGRENEKEKEGTKTEAKVCCPVWLTCTV